MNTIIFDLDGTLIDSAPAILAGFSAALAEEGLKPIVPLTAALIGPPLPEALKILTGEEDSLLIQSLIDRFKSYYDLEGFRLSQAYDGIETVLNSLKSAGYQLHLATNKRLIPTEKILSHFKWDSLFSSIYAIDKLSPRFENKTAMLAAQLEKECIDSNQTFYIGDTPADAIASRANGLTFLAAGWGYGAFSQEEKIYIDPLKLLEFIQKQNR